MKRLLKSYIFLGLLTILIVGLDQVTKAWVRNTIPVGTSIFPIEGLAPFFRIVHWYNTGAAFGMLQGFGDVFTILAVIVVIVIIIYYPRVPEYDWTLRLAMGFQLGGALGNLVDRLTIGHVTDFLAFGSFPVFNVADSSISIGVAVLILGMLLQEWKAKQNAKKGIVPGGPTEVSNGESTH